jgi:hypothetical protein
MLAAKMMDAVKKEHITPFNKHLPICDPTFRIEFLWQIQFHYDLNPKLEMLMEKVQMLVFSNVSSEQKVNLLKQWIQSSILHELHKSFQRWDSQMPHLITGCTRLFFGSRYCYLPHRSNF